MKKSILTLAGLLFLAGAGVAQATPVTILDNYIGGSGSSSSTADIIGTQSAYDVTKMEVSFFDSGGSKGFYLDIYSTYLNNINSYGLGDIFISTDGWSPYGSAPYGSDSMLKAGHTTWELALVLDNHFNNSVHSGDLGLYSTAGGGSIEKTSVRTEHEARFNPSAGNTALATGSWSIEGLSTYTETDNFLRIAIGYDFGSASNFGFH